MELSFFKKKKRFDFFVKPTKMGFTEKSDKTEIAMQGEVCKFLYKTVQDTQGNFHDR